MEDLRYPIGGYAWPSDPVPAPQRARWLQDVADAPAALRAATVGLTDAQLDTPYRPGGWTVRQVVHHVPDSHVQAYIRFKLALTEEEPTIKPYHEDRWAKLADYSGPVDVSLRLLEDIHKRWVAVMGAMEDLEWARTFLHPEQGRTLRLDGVLGMYAWHGAHHVAHVTRLRERESWS